MQGSSDSAKTVFAVPFWLRIAMACLMFTV